MVWDLGETGGACVVWEVEGELRACLCGSPNSTGRFEPADRGGVRGGRWLCVVMSVMCGQLPGCQLRSAADTYCWERADTDSSAHTVDFQPVLLVVASVWGSGALCSSR